MKRLIALAVFAVFLLVVGSIGVWLRFGVNFLNLDVYGGTDNYHYGAVHYQEEGNGQRSLSSFFLTPGSYCRYGPPNYGYQDPDGDDRANVQMAKELCSVNAPTTIDFSARLYFPPGKYKATCNNTGCFTLTSNPVRPFSSVNIETSCLNGVCRISCTDWKSLRQVPCP